MYSLFRKSSTGSCNRCLPVKLPPDGLQRVCSVQRQSYVTCQPGSGFPAMMWRKSEAACRRPIVAGCGSEVRTITLSREFPRAGGQIQTVVGEPAGTRTQNPCLKGAMLYRLSYRPG